MPDKDYEIEFLGEVYGTALLNIAQKKNIVDDITDDIRSLGELLKADAAFSTFIADVTVTPEDHAKAMEKIFTGRVSPYTVETLKCMARRGRLVYLGGLVSAWEVLLKRAAGVVDAEVISAADLPAETVDRVRDAISRATGKKAELKLKTQPDILGGIKVRIGDTLIDASVETQLARIHSQLTRGGVADVQDLQSVVE